MWDCNAVAVCVVFQRSCLDVLKYKILSSVKPCYHHVNDNILNSTDTHHDDDTDTWTRSDHWTCLQYTDKYIKQFKTYSKAINLSFLLPCAYQIIIIIIIIEWLLVWGWGWTFVFHTSANVALQLTPVAFTALCAKEPQVGQQGTMLLTTWLRAALLQPEFL